MLTELAIENFKPFATLQTAPLAPITLVYGPNSSGKSSIIQSLLLLRQSITTPQTRDFGLIPRGGYTDLGSFKSMVHRHELTRHLRFRVSFSPPKAPQSGGKIEKAIHGVERTLTMKFEACASPRSRKKDSSRLSEIEYGLDSGKLLDTRLSRVTRTQVSEAVLAATAYEPDVSFFQWADEKSLRSFAEFIMRAVDSHRGVSRGTANPLGGPAEGSINASEMTTIFMSMFESAVCWARGGLPGRLGMDWERQEGDARPRKIPPPGIQQNVFELLNIEAARLFSSLEYLGPLRSYPERFYLIRGGSAPSVGTKGENTPQVLFRGAQEIPKEINYWFRTFEIPYSIKLHNLGDAITGEIVSIHLSDLRSRVQVAPSDVGFGIGQLLPILVQGVISDKQTLCVEQPEIHLHPRLQACLADFFISTAGVGADQRISRRVQWIVETHSEALVLRLQRRIRSGEIQGKDVSVLYVCPDDDGSSKILNLRLDESGNFIDPWPGGFFDEATKELFT